MFVLLVSTWIHIRRGHHHSGQRPSCSVVHFPFRGVLLAGLGDGVGDCHDAAVSQKVFFPLKLFQVELTMLFFKGYGLFFVYAAEYASN